MCKHIRLVPCWCKCLLFLHRFIEHGEYKENQYGTSIEAIRSVQAKNKMCVVDVQPEVRVMLQQLSTSCLIFIHMYHVMSCATDPAGSSSLQNVGSHIRSAHCVWGFSVDPLLSCLICVRSVLYCMQILHHSRPWRGCGQQNSSPM